MRSWRTIAADLPPAYWLLWAGTLVNRVGGFVVPFLTLYLTTQRHLAVGEAALVVSLYGAGSFAAQLTGGELSDRVGRRPVMLLSFLGAPPAMIALGHARGLPTIAGCTLALGFLTELYRPAVSAAVADLVPPASRARAYGYLYWAINLGFAIAPALAGLLAGIAYVALFVGDAATTLAFGILVAVGLRETRPPASTPAGRGSLVGRARQLGRAPVLLAFCALGFCFGLVYLQGHVTLPVAMQGLGLGPRSYGLALAVNGLLVVLLGLPASHVVGRWPRFPTMAAAAALLGAGFGLHAAATTLPATMAAVAVWTLGEIAGASVGPAIIADLAPADLRGLYQGVHGASWGLASFVGPVAGGWVLQHRGPTALWLGCLATGLLVACGHLILARVTRAHR